MSQLLKSDRPPAIILAGSIAADLALIRNLAIHRIPSIICSSDNKHISTYSRYCQKQICPNPKTDEKSYIEFLIDLGKKLNRKAVLFPTCDIELIATLKHSRELESYYHFTSAPYECVNQLVNKKNFYELLQKLNIAHARTFFPKNNEDVKKISEKFSYPCIIKPAYSAWFIRDFYTKLFIAHTKKELIIYYEETQKNNYEVLIQEIIPGDATHNYGLNAYYDTKGSIHANFMYQRIRDYPLTFGNGYSLKRVNIPMFENLVNPLLKHIKYHGIIDAEIKKDPRDNTFKLVEINARSWMQIGFPCRYNLNIPYITYLDSIGEPIPPQQKESYNNDVKWFYFTYDLLSAFELIKKKEQSFSDYIQSYKGRKEYAIFSRHDPLPLVVSSVNNFYRIPQIILRTSKKKQYLYRN